MYDDFSDVDLTRFRAPRHGPWQHSAGQPRPLFHNLDLHNSTHWGRRWSSDLQSTNRQISVGWICWLCEWTWSVRRGVGVPSHRIRLLWWRTKRTNLRYLNDDIVEAKGMQNIVVNHNCQSLLMLNEWWHCHGRRQKAEEERETLRGVNSTRSFQHTPFLNVRHRSSHWWMACRWLRRWIGIRADDDSRNLTNTWLPLSTHWSSGAFRFLWWFESVSPL